LKKKAKPKIYGIPAYKTEDKKLEKQHPTASTPIHDNLATADFVTQPLVSPIQNHLTLPPVLPKATTGGQQHTWYATATKPKYRCT
jgi:hypothetical protein